MPHPETFGSTGLLQGRVVQVEGQVELHLAGDLDLVASPSLRRRVMELAETSQGDLVLDLEALDFLGSTGLRTLLALTGEFAQMDRRLVLRSPSPAVMRVLDLAEISDALNLA